MRQFSISLTGSTAVIAFAMLAIGCARNSRDPYYDDYTYTPPPQPMAAVQPTPIPPTPTPPPVTTPPVYTPPKTSPRTTSRWDIKESDPERVRMAELWLNEMQKRN